MTSNRDLTTVVITCQIQPGKMDIAREEFTAIIKTVVSKEATCHWIDLLHDPENPNRLLLIESWDSKEAFTGPHMQTSHMQAFFERAKSFLAAPPETGFWRRVAAAP